VPRHAKASRSRLDRINKKRVGITAGVILAVIGVAVGFIVSGGSTKPKATSAASAPMAVSSGKCPLTDLPAPHGVPQRPALLVKIGNEPDGARPQGGLNEADIVFDTPAEGFIMRYMAVYQCNNASSIGPTRSVRWVDYHLARMFLHPILAFAGGINWNVDAVMSDSWLEPANLLNGASSAGTRITSRVAPDNLFTSTAALYALNAKQHTPPPAVFSYSTSLPGSAAADMSSVQINYSYDTDVVWTWNASGDDWTHSYAGGGTDIDTDSGQPVTTTNVVMLVVSYRVGTHIESTGGTGDIESQTLGSGRGWVLRDGKRIGITWHRNSLIDGLTFTDASGAAVSLAPGRTWVEIVPDTVANATGGITFTP
jgi:hypothetical protein